jgi:hypothetical protein
MRLPCTSLIFKGWAGLSVQDEAQRFEYLSAWMRVDCNLKLQRRGRGDFDVDLGAHFTFHSLIVR